MKSIFKIYWIVINCLSPLLLFAQPLPELIRQVEANNLALKGLDRAYEAAFEKAPQVGILPNLEVEVGGFLSPVETRLGAQRLRLSTTQSFPWFGTLKAEKDVANAEAQPIYEEITNRKLELTYEVKKTYYQLYGISETKKIIARNVRILEALRTLALSKIESGRGSTADVLKADLRIQELEQQLVILDNQALAPAADLNQLLNRPLDSPFYISDQLDFAQIPFNKATLFERVTKDHPLPKAFALEQEIARKRIALNQLLAKPQLKVGIDYLTVDAREDAFPLNNGRDALQIRAGIKIPLSKSSYKAKEREENFRMEASNHRRLDIINRLKADIEKAFINYETAVLHYQLYRNQINTMNAAIQVLQSSYSIDGRDFDELLRLEMNLVEYDIKTLNTIVESHLIKAKLEMFTN